MLSHSLRWFYYGKAYPFLHIQTGNHMWFRRVDKITGRSYSLTPQQLSESLFKWVFK